MKLRTGFVSNSSSSSFVVTTTIENHTKAMSVLDAFQQSVVNKIMTEKTKVFGRQAIRGCVSDSHGIGTFSEDMGGLQPPAGVSLDDFEDEPCEYTYPAWEAYLAEINKNPDEVISTYDDF